MTDLERVRFTKGCEKSNSIFPFKLHYLNSGVKNNAG